MTNSEEAAGGGEPRSSRLASPEPRRYLASAPVPLAIYDAERIIFLNEAGVELLGVGTADDLIGEPVLELVHPDDRERAARRIREVLEERRPSPEEEYRIVRPDGEVRYAAIRSIPVVHDGRPAVQSMVHDVTQEVEARRRLEESEARFRAVAESARDGLVTVDTDSRIVYANPAAHDIFDYPEGDLVGRTLTELMPDDTGDRYLEAVREHLASSDESLGRSGVELPAVRRNGTRLTIGVSFAAYEIEGTPYYTGIIRDVSERKDTESELRRRRERLARILDSLQEGITILDRDGRISYANHAATRILGLESSRIVGRSYDSPEWRITDPDGQPVDPEDLPAARSLRTGEAVWDETLVVDRPHEDPVILSVSASPYAPQDEDGVMESIVSFSDITERMRERRALRQSEERYRLVFEDSKDVIYITGRDGTILAMNPAGEELFGFPREELIGMNAIDLYHRPRERRQFQRVIENRGYVDDFEFEARTRSGAVRNCLLTSTVRTDDEGEVVGYQGIIRDITERKKFEQELEHRALHDDLTELPNRTLFFDRLEQTIARTERTGNPMAVLFLDLDGFKAVNDSLGHTAGDQVLTEVARRLASAVREPDTVARVGGDEFTVLLEGLEAPDHVEEVSERIAEALGAPFTAAGENVHLKASIGVARLEMRDGALFPELESPEDLVRRADAAMFRAKDLSSTRYLLYDPELDVAETARIQRENDLRRALEEEEFVLHYQPVVSLPGGEIRGVEPLVRWDHRDRGMLEPSEFLSLAEETGLIIPLGRWILRRSADRVAAWSEQLGRQLEVYPNLSAAQFEDPGLTDLVTDVLTEFDLAPGSLHLEVTEHLVMRAPERTRRLARLGVAIVIDDFGTGYSSLSYVRDLEVHSLKVDRTFVAGLGRSPQDEAIVTTILTLGDALDLEVVAEGVETREQLDWLRDAGCPAAQGFFLARPLPAAAAGELLATWDGPPEGA